jgi:hypothetical protein
MLNEVESQVIALCDELSSRLHQWQTALAKSYVEHGELPLAIESLADFLIEEAAPISEAELDALVRLASKFPHLVDFSKRALFLKEDCVRRV